MANTMVQSLIESGVHYGHRCSRWNPKMAPYIYARKNQIHIIDIRETIRGLLRAKKYITQVASKGSLVLIVGTKRQASGTVEREAQRCGMPFVSQRWLGGALTNFRTVRSRLGRLEELEELRAGDKIDQYSKKMQSSLNREYRKMYRNLNGLRTMNRLPECVVVIDPNKERNAVREARKLGIATIALIDSDCDPDIVDLPIPGNDDGIRSIEVILQHISEAVLTGNPQAAVAQEEAAAEKAAAATAAAAAKPPVAVVTEATAETAEEPAATEEATAETAEEPAATEEATTETAEEPAATEEATTETAEEPAATEEATEETAEESTEEGTEEAS
jgi:small subunit ribosomal protein S2